LAVRDVDGDGASDIVVVGQPRYTDGGISQTWLNDGSGDFAFGTTGNAGGWPQEIELGDLDGNGELDVVIADAGGLANGSVLTVLDGSTVRPVVGSIFALELGDLNGDGRLDIVALEATSTPVLAVLLNQGGGAFAPRADYATGAEPDHGYRHSLALADLDRDGRPDIVVVTPAVDRLSVLLNQGGGTFAPAMLSSPVDDPLAVRVADFDGDGRQDLAVLSGTAAAVSVLPGGGDGSFGSPIVTSVDTGATDIALGDVNGDGHIDLVVVASNTLRVLLNDGQAHFPTSLVLANGLGWRAPVVADLDGDQRPEVIMAGGDQSLANCCDYLYVVPNGCLMGGG
jgi:hypothetical protein